MCSCFLADCVVAAHDQPCSSVCSCSVVWLTPHEYFKGQQQFFVLEPFLVKESGVLCVLWFLRVPTRRWECSLVPSRTDKTLGMFFVSFAYRQDAGNVLCFLRVPTRRWECSLFPSRTDNTLGMQVLVLALIPELVNTGSVVLICDIDSISCSFDCSLIVCTHVFLMHPSSGTHARTHAPTDTQNTICKVSHWLLQLPQTTHTHVYDMDKPTSTADIPWNYC